MCTLRLKNLMSVMTFLKLAVPRHTITSVPVGIHPRAHCTQNAMSPASCYVCKQTGSLQIARKCKMCSFTTWVHAPYVVPSALSGFYARPV